LSDWAVVRWTTGGGTRAAALAAAVFVVLSLVATWIIDVAERGIVDTEVYKTYADAIRSGLVPYRDFDVEYPPGAVLVFAVSALGGSGTPVYFWAFEFGMALVGGVGVLLMAASLRRLGRSPQATRTVLALLALSPLVFGGVLLTRFDLVPATLVAGATLLLLSRRPRAAALVLGAAAAVKLYPLALLPVLAAWIWRRTGRREALVACALVLGVVALAYLPFALLAPEAVASSVWGQLSRPLQIESLGAGVLLLLHHAAGLEVVIATSDGSDNLTGALAAAVASALSVASIAAVGWLSIAFARGEASSERLVRYCAALLLALVAFGKLLSPQFLLWLLFPLALVGGRRGASAGACYAVAAVATAVWFPWFYRDLPTQLDPALASLVVLRGLALVAALAVLAWPTPEGVSGSLGYGGRSITLSVGAPKPKRS
jgi:hypothetical protein